MKELWHFAMILPNSQNNGMVVPFLMYKIYNGNTHMPLQEKIELDKCQHLLFPIHKIIPNIPE